MLKEPKIRSEKHRRFIASLPCVICRCTDTQAAHIRTGNSAGMGLKSGDDCCLPLCVRCHAEQHHFSEKRFWDSNLGKAQTLAKELYRVTGNKGKAIELIAGFK